MASDRALPLSTRHIRGAGGVRAVARQPLHAHVRDTLAGRIERGELPPGTLLPPEVELARQFGVSRQTVRAGLDALVRAGMIERTRGKGTLVRRPPIRQSLSRFYSLAHEMASRGASLTTLVLARGRLSAHDTLAAQACAALEGAAPEEVGFLLRLRLVDGTPLALETLTFPAALCPDVLAAPASGAADRGEQSFYTLLEDAASVRVTHAHETLCPVAVAGYEAQLLGVPTGTPVFEVERTSFAGERAVEWRRSLARGDLYTYAVDLLNPSDAPEGAL